MDAIAKGISISLLPWFLSEHSLHGITFLSLFLTLLGFLYLSYDLLGKPRGVLSWFLIVITHLAVSLLVLSALAPLMLLLFRQALMATNTPPTLVDPSEQIADMIVYTLMIAVLQGTLIAFPPPRRPVKRFVWRDGLIGFLFALLFFSVDEYGTFQTPINDVMGQIPDLLLFVLIGVAGAGFWRRYGQRNHFLHRSRGAEEGGATDHVPEIMQRKDEPLPPLFSFADFISGFLFWFIVVGLSISLWVVSVVLDQPWYGPLGQLPFYLVDVFIGAAPAGLVCGSSQYITWKVHHLGEKQLGVIGAIISLLGLLLSLIEPLVLFLTKP